MPDENARQKSREDVNASREGYNSAREHSNVAREDSNTLREDANLGEEVVHDKAKNEMLGYLKFLRWMVLVLAVMVAGAIARSYATQDQLDEVSAAADRTTEASERTEQASNDARSAAQGAAADLADAIARIEANNTGEPDLQNQAIIDALAAVARIEFYLCGGTCE